MGGRGAYRASEADEAAWRRATRPKRCKLAQNRALGRMVADKLRLEWSPYQVAGWLKRTYPQDETRQVSHETIYRTLFIQARGALRKELNVSPVYWDFTFLKRNGFPASRRTIGGRRGGKSADHRTFGYRAGRAGPRRGRRQARRQPGDLETRTLASLRGCHGGESSPLRSQREYRPPGSQRRQAGPSYRPVVGLQP